MTLDKPTYRRLGWKKVGTYKRKEKPAKPYVYPVPNAHAVSPLGDKPQYRILGKRKHPPAPKPLSATVRLFNERARRQANKRKLKNENN